MDFPKKISVHKKLKEILKFPTAEAASSEITERKAITERKSQESKESLSFKTVHEDLHLAWLLVIN